MIEAYINGIRQVPGIDFVARGNSVSFMSPPATGAGIQIVYNGYSICNLIGNGTTFLFTGPFADADQQDKLIDLLRQAFDYRDNPAVADALERLQVVMELVKQECQTN
jgi:hypothetical protein